MYANAAGTNCGGCFPGLFRQVLELDHWEHGHCGWGALRNRRLSGTLVLYTSMDLSPTVNHDHFNSTWPFLIQWIRVRIVRWHADLAYIKISIISVCNKPYYTHQGNVQKGEEICGTVHSNIMQVYQNYDNRFWNIFSRDRDLKVFKHFGLAFHFLPSQRKRLAVLHDIDISYPCVCLWEHFMRCVFWICSSCCWFCRPLPSWNSRTATKSSRQAVTTGSDVGMLVVTSAITSLKDMVWCRILL